MNKRRITIPPALAALPDNELARIFECSRQAVLFARRRQAHQCVKCGRNVQDGTALCTTHRIEARKYQRQRNRNRNGHRPWKPGRRGRKPFEEKAA
ncbi:MAG: hypothetical protein KGL39_27450 [Patescibacteria group bacterium]|nr:hypothetical protein [Patescibacteria group bacterium]